MIEKSVSIYDRGADGVYFHPSTFTVSGLLVAIPPFKHIAAEDKKNNLWNTTIELLKMSKGRVPHPTRWNLLDPMIKMAGCKNWKDFAKKSHLCSVDISSNKYSFMPHRWDGKGFEGLRSSSKTVDMNLDDSVYIEILLQCFENCI